VVVIVSGRSRLQIAACPTQAAIFLGRCFRLPGCGSRSATDGSRVEGCGLIGEKYPGMDMVSMGPQIESPHSPDERVQISTVDRFYTFLKATLAELA
jgi:hypothetical protein